MLFSVIETAVAVAAIGLGGGTLIALPRHGPTAWARERLGAAIDRSGRMGWVRGLIGCVLCLATWIGAAAGIALASAGMCTWVAAAIGAAAGPAIYGWRVGFAASGGCGSRTASENPAKVRLHETLERAGKAASTAP